MSQPLARHLVEEEEEGEAAKLAGHARWLVQEKAQAGQMVAPAGRELDARKSKLRPPPTGRRSLSLRKGTYLTSTGCQSSRVSIQPTILKKVSHQMTGVLKESWLQKI